MGILGKLTPERAKIAVCIATAMHTKCFNCEHSGTEKVFGQQIKQPNVDSEECKACLDVIRKQLFNGATDGSDSGNV